MYNYQEAKKYLLKNSKTWLITGCAGFIGSNLVEQLLLLNQKVIGVDNLYSGSLTNLEDIKNNISSQQWQNFEYHDLDINNKISCNKIFNNNINYVLHHAAVCSVPFSIANPEICYNTNVGGFENIIELSLEYNVDSFIYASSSSVYGDNQDTLKTESNIGNPLSPYAKSKLQDEIIAENFSNKFNLNTTGLRYFNVYGKRQDPHGEYSAVIPKWLCCMLNNNFIYINGDGNTTRDFCYIDDVVQANILAAMNHNNNEKFQVLNIGTGKSITLNNLYKTLIQLLHSNGIEYNKTPEYKTFLPGDIKESCPDISKAINQINFNPIYNLASGLDDLITWYNK